ncbi:MAG: SGNH/GDSL hydrolase family protein [Pseudomonadota bacterium]
MRPINFAPALIAAAVLAGCGGGGGGDQTPKVKFSSQVSFGDSLSDVGTYKVGTVAALGGGKFSINGPDSKNWTELMAAQFGLPAPCPAQTGLKGDATKGFSVPVVSHAGCTGYAQGSARVTNPVGPHSYQLGDPIGLLTVPVITQIQTHLAANGGSFKGDEIVFVMAGGNDVFAQTGGLSAGAMAAATAAVTAAVPAQIQTDIASGACVPANATASNCQAPAVTKLTATVGAAAAAAYVKANAPASVMAMGVAGGELATYVKTLIVGKGAKYVVVVNLPDVSQTPSGLAQSAETRGLINAMVTTFNTQLKKGIDGDASILYVDAYSVDRDQATNPGIYGLSNVSTPACDANPVKNPLEGYALTCTKANLIASANEFFKFADPVHPTPYTYLLLARLVSKDMITRGWL